MVNANTNTMVVKRLAGYIRQNRTQRNASDYSPVSLFAEATPIDMGQHKPAEEEKQVDSKRSAAPQPRRSASCEIERNKTTVVEQYRYRRDASQRGQARQFRLGAPSGRVDSDKG